MNIIQSNSNSLINRGALSSLNLGQINSELINLFQEYYISFNKICGNELFNFQQIRRVKDVDDTTKQYGKGRILVKNSIDKLRYLLEHSKEISQLLRLQDSHEIFNNRRNIGKVSEYISKLNEIYELGDDKESMQLYISRTDSNDKTLDSENDWYDYIMTTQWVQNLGKSTISEKINISDTRIQYVSDMISGMMTDHEIDYHLEEQSFDETLYLDKGDNNTTSGLGRFIDAFNRFNSLGSLNYCFYELFKPIGGTDEKYLKVRLFVNGTMEIQGVIGLSDCKYVEWEYGTQEYLRSLNTGNKKYEFKIDLPFNDKNSTLWWKPDDKIEIMDINGQPTGKYEYYKQYEKERFLRWFGSDRIPRFAIDNITKMSIGQAPKVLKANSINTMFQDSTNIVDNQTLQRRSITEQTSISLLNLSQKSTIDIINRDTGQYLQFIVGGHQQTENIAFHIVGSIEPTIQELNHYENTFNLLNDLYIKITSRMLYLNILSTMNPNIINIWQDIHGKTYPFIPQYWIDIAFTAEYVIENLSAISLLRLRQIDFDSINKRINNDIDERLDYMKNPLNNLSNITSNIIKSKYGIDETLDLGNSDLFNYISKFNQNQNDSIPSIPEQAMKNIAYTIKKLHENKFKASFQTNVQDLKSRIETFNTLIVRLPTKTWINKTTSRHIFLDWKNYVDKSIQYLISHNMLFYRKDSQGNAIKSSGIGTDNKHYDFIEYYTKPECLDGQELIDYSYCIDQLGHPIHDRWEYWVEDDFLS